MIKVGRETKLAPSEVADKAMEFFGPSGEGLAAMHQGEGCIRFEGGGGFVFVLAERMGAGARTEVTIEGREWEEEIKKFLGKL